MMMKDVNAAYTSRSSHALADAFRKLQRQLVRKVQTLGPAAVALELRHEQSLPQILNRIEAEVSNKPQESVAFLAGFIRAYVDYIRLIADHHDVDSANAKLSVGRDENDPVDTIRMMILRAAYAHAGARAKELVSVVARTADVSESLVKFHLRKLEDAGLIERLKLGPKAVSYRITPLGEAILARRSKPYELALLYIDEAASDKELRAAIVKEINIAWRDEQDEEGGAAQVIQIFFETPPEPEVVTSEPWSKIGDMYKEYLTELGSEDEGEAAA